MTRTVVLGFALPEERFSQILAQESGMPSQTQRFGRSLVQALEAGGAQVGALSFAPVTDYPHNYQVIFRSAQTIEGELLTRELPFVNITGVKHITRFVSAFRALRRNAKSADWVVVHGVNSSLLAAALLNRRLGGSRVAVVLTDPPSLKTQFDNRLTVTLKWLDRIIITSAVRRVAAVITLAPALATDLAPSVPNFLMEGIVPTLPGGQPSHSNSDVGFARDNPEIPWGRIVVYAGQVDARYGVVDLAHAVGLSEGDWHLLVLGRGPHSDIIEKLAREDPRVHFGGLVAYDSLPSIYARAAVLVNPRPLDDDYVRYSFPSKLMEFMASGTPVVTTAIPTLPEDYRSNVVIAPAGPAGLARTIDSLMSMDKGQRDSLGALAASFIGSTRSLSEQGRRMVKFLESLS